MAEPAVSAFLRVLLAKLTSPELLNFEIQDGVRSKLQKWEKTLKMIEVLLIDAEEKQLTNEAVKTWLEDLQDLAFDAEDILDEYATEALRRKLEIDEHQTNTSKTRELIPELKMEEDQTSTIKAHKLIPELKMEEDLTSTNRVGELIREPKIEEDQTSTIRAQKLIPELKMEEDRTSISRSRKLIPERKIEEDRTSTSRARKLIPELKIEEDRTSTSRARELIPEMKIEEDRTSTSRARELIPEMKIEEDRTSTSWARKLIRKLKIEGDRTGTSCARKLVPTCCIGSTPNALQSHFSIRSNIDDEKMACQSALRFDFSIRSNIDDEKIGPLDGNTSQSALRSNLSFRSNVDDEKMGSLDDIISRLQDLYEQGTDLGLVETAGERPIVSSQRALTTFLPTELAIYGRDEDKAKILKLVLRHEPDDTNFGVIAIVGIGGIGKTTLAQEVYNDEAVKDFDPKAWVCVSEDFDVTKISIAILESITGRGTNLETLHEVQRELTKNVSGRKFLLVLDDVWNNDSSKWAMLTLPFTVGARGSKFIVATRSEHIALKMGCSNEYKLNELSDDDCWSLFCKHAVDNEVMGTYPNELIREKVIEKCRGLPLAARTLGGLLHSKKKDERFNILNSKTWELLDKSEIPPALQISYYYLPSHLKRCFVYCGIFPKTHEFEQKELVLLWIAEGLIQQSNGSKQLEELGGEYFYDLLSRSMFQISSHNSSKFIMHDLVNDLARMVSAKLSFRREDKLEWNDQLRLSKKTRYASHICHQFDGKRKFDIFNDAKRLRTHLAMLLLNDMVKTHYISKSVVSNLLSRFKKLRALSLEKYHLIELPDSIGSLRHLRYLNLSDSHIRSLPESVTLIWNLQTLLLRNCRELSKWPNNMGNLCNLRHLDILGASSIKEMPEGIQKWKYLRTLSNFIMGQNSRSSLKDLKDLQFLSGELHISKLENVTNLQDIRNVIFDKKDLKVLLLEWGSRFDESRDEEVDNEVFDILRPNEKLDKLTIKGYGGTCFSSWVRSSSFSESNMMVLELVDCNKCTSLPSLGLLGSLRNLTIKGMKGLKTIGSEFYGENCLNPFQSLETLYIENLEECEYWEPIEEHESFSKLKELSIVDCPKLSKRLPNNLSLLKKLVIRRCEQLEVSLSNIPTVCKLELGECKKIVCSSSTFSESLESMTFSNIQKFGDMSMQEIKKVTSLDIEGCEELIELWQNEIFLEKPSQGLHSFTSINKLNFQNCSTLTTLVEGIKQKNIDVEELRTDSCDSLNYIFKGQLPKSLKKLNIENCEKLQCLLVDNEDTCESSLSSTVVHKEKVNANTFHLEVLDISYCPVLRCLPSVNQLPATLTRLCIKHCYKLTTLSMPAALEHLEISYCPELTTVSSDGQLPRTLKTLTISWCWELESIVEKFHNNKALYKIYIYGCNKLKSLPKGLETLSMLRSIEIEQCRSFGFFPDEEFPNSKLSIDQEGLFHENLRVWIKGCETLSSQVSLGDLSVGLRRCWEIEALPKGIHTLSSLQIFNCPKSSFSTDVLPTNLASLEIEGLEHYKAVMEWRFHSLTSLTYLCINGGLVSSEGVESIQETNMEITLPPNLTWLQIQYFEKLKCLPFKHFQGLSSLESLSIRSCPELTSLPSILPSSLLQLQIWGCPSLIEACKRNRGKEWPKIANIPYVEIDYKVINDQEE